MGGRRNATITRRRAAARVGAAAGRPCVFGGERSRREFLLGLFRLSEAMVAGEPRAAVVKRASGYVAYDAEGRLSSRDVIR